MAPRVKVLPPKAETPSEQLVALAIQPTLVTDTRGRKIKLAKPGVLAQFRTVKALGDAAQNQSYVSMLLPLLFVAEIDGDPVALPASEREFEALIQRLDEDGLAAVMKGVQANFGEPDVEAAKATARK